MTVRPKILALILAGGAGGRMKILTDTRAKPVLPYAGVYRLIDFPLSNCVHSRLSDVWIVEQFQPHELNDHLVNGRPWDLDRTNGGLRIMPPYTGAREGGWSEGNAEAIYRNRRFIREFAPDVLLVMSADHVYKLDYRDVIDAHYERAAEVTMVTTEVSVERAHRFGTVETGDGGAVTKFDYKPDKPQSGVVTTEVFAYDARALLDTLEALAAADKKGAGEGGDGEGGDGSAAQGLKDFGHKLLPALIERGRAYAYPLAGYWRDVGTIRSYWESHMELLRPTPPLDLDDAGWPVLTQGNQRMPAHVHAAARVENSLVAPGCVVRGHVVNSVLAPGVVVEEGALVQDSIIFHDAVIGPGARVRRAILDGDARVGEDSIIGESRAQTSGDDGANEAAPEGDNSAEQGDIALVGRWARLPRGARVPAGGCVKPHGTAEDAGANGCDEDS